MRHTSIIHWSLLGLSRILDGEDERQSCGIHAQNYSLEAQEAV